MFRIKLKTYFLRFKNCKHILFDQSRSCPGYRKFDFQVKTFLTLFNGLEKFVIASVI